MVISQFDDVSTRNYLRCSFFRASSGGNGEGATKKGQKGRPVHHSGQLEKKKLNGAKQGVNEGLKDPRWMKTYPAGAITWLYIYISRQTRRSVIGSECGAYRSRHCVHKASMVTTPDEKGINQKHARHRRTP
jgi:hypothetical protein